MSRKATCRVCGEPFITPADTGRLPHRCLDCAATSGASATTARYRAEILSLRQRIAALEADRARYLGDVGREELARAVRRAGWAQGPTETRVALQYLRDVAHTWAVRLDEGIPNDHQEAA